MRFTVVIQKTKGRKAMIKLNINYGNLVKINCLCTEEQAEILDHYFYGLIQPGFVDDADYTLTYGGNINQRQMKDPSKWKIFFQKESLIFSISKPIKSFFIAKKNSL